MQVAARESFIASMAARFHRTHTDAQYADLWSGDDVVILWLKRKVTTYDAATLAPRHAFGRCDVTIAHVAPTEVGVPDGYIAYSWALDALVFVPKKYADERP